MDRLKQIARLWQYLPTFRVVAELEHVTKAAAVLGITPSAVSRTVGLLEAELGHALFVRAGRRILLNDAGKGLLASVRVSMRMVDEGVIRAEHHAFVGPVRVAGVEPFACCIAAGMLGRLRARHGGLVPSLARAAEQDVARHILSGVLDAAFVRHCPRQSELLVTRIASFDTAAFAAPGHALFARKGAAAVSGEASVDVERGRDVPSPWPPELARRIALVVADYDLALSACLGAGLVAVLPVVMASPHEASGGLRRLPRVRTSPIPLYAVTRQTIAAPGRAEAVVEAAREEARALEKSA